LEFERQQARALKQQAWVLSFNTLHTL
jgi:hypothetical protein